MKRSYVVLVVLLIAALGTGCPSTPKATQPTAPSWFSELPPEDAFWGIGIAKMTNDSLGLETATTRASRDVARQIGQLVQGLLTDYSREAGLVNNPASVQHIENIGRNLVNANLAGARVNRRERMPDGTWYVRVSLSNGELERVINSVYDNEAASFAEWKKDEALKRLDAMLTNSYPPQGVSSD